MDGQESASQEMLLVWVLGQFSQASSELTFFN